MSSHDDDGVYRSDSNRRQKTQRRKQFAVGAVGLAAVLGAGAYVITAQVMDRDNNTITTDTGALAPMITPSVPPASAPPVPTPSASVEPTTATKSAVKQSASPAPAPSVSGYLSPDEEIRRARAAAARDGVPQLPALTAAAREPGPVTERNERVKNGTLRVITARFDLTGHRALLWAADGGTAVGSSKCTQKVRFSQNAKPAVQPNLLLCWRTSAEKSVATILVDQKGHPSTATSVKVIDEEWAKLG